MKQTAEASLFSQYRTRFLRVSLITLLVLALADIAQAQQAASIDLLRPPVVTKAPVAASQAAQQPRHTDTCSGADAGVIADGVVLGPDKIPRKIVVDLVTIRSSKLPIGSETVAVVKLKNAGEKPIQIPWSTDAEAISKDQDPDNLAWEFAEFRFSIRDARNPSYFDHLITTSLPLFASKSVAGSSLTLKPGEWITAQISFKMEVEYPEFEKLNVGTAELALEWFQTARTWSISKCGGVSQGYFPYDDPFESLNRKVVTNVEIAPPIPVTLPLDHKSNLTAHPRVRVGAGL